MSRGKNRGKRAPKLILGVTPTPERLRADEWDDGADKQGHRLNAKDTPHRMRSRIARMERDKWIDREQAAALAAYELLREKAGFGASRSCLDNTPRGGGEGTGGIDARARLADVRSDCDTVGLMVVDAILWPDPSFGPQTVTQVAVRLFPGREATAMRSARRFVETVATQLAEVLQVTRRPRLHVVRAA